MFSLPETKIKERINSKCCILYKEYKVVFLASVICGLLAYAFLLTNKIPCYDDVRYFMGKGGMLNHGRWGLYITEWFMPSISLPWFYGVMSLLLIAVGNCFLIHTFQIRSKVLQALLSGATTVFTTEIDIMLYMFMASSFAFAFLLTMIATDITEYNKRWYMSIIFVVLAISIYQAFATLFSSLLIVLIIKKLYVSKIIKKPFYKTLLRYLIVVLASLGAYYLITQLLWKIFGTELHPYVQSVSDRISLSQIPYNVKRAWLCFLDIFTIRRYGLLVSYFSAKVHEICGGIVVLAILVRLVTDRKWRELIIASILMFILLPISVTGMILYFGENAMNMRTFYSFIAVYVLACCIADGTKIEVPVSVCLALVVANNIFFANVVYLRQQLNYETSKSRLENILSVVYSNPDYVEGCKLAIVGDPNPPEYTDYLGQYYVTSNINLINGADTEEFMRLYLGFDGEFASLSEISELENSPEAQKMPSFPYYGSVDKIGEYMVVKLN